MTLFPVKASNWVKEGLTPEERVYLKRSGIVPVNDVFLPLWEKPASLELARGGRGGGKSTEIFKKKIHKCITTPYFKCYYGRKIFDTVRGSCFETLVACIEDMGLSRDFHYSTANTSSMIITHKATGNKFIPFGSDKAEKLKSIKDPTDIVCEEFDQFTFDDFKDIYPTLRYEGAFCQFTAMFNTHGVDMNHWIIKVFFKDLYEGEDKSQFDMLDGIDVLSLFVNFTDNHFIDQEDYRKKLMLASGGNMRLFEAIANGAWGIFENDKPWLYDFEFQKHAVDNIPFLPSYPVYLSFDFNNDPFGCVAAQMSPQKGERDSFLHIIKEFSGKIKLEEMCTRIRSAYPASIFYVTGDRSGSNEDVGRNQSLYKMIAGYLQVSERNMNLNNTNLEHADSRYLCNVMMRNYPNLKISKSGCPNLLKQCEIARIDEKSKKPHHLLKDREIYKMDEFDAMRYLFQTYYNQWVSKTYINALNKK